MMIWQLERPEMRRGGQRALADYVRLRVLCPGQTLLVSASYAAQTSSWSLPALSDP